MAWQSITIPPPPPAPLPHQLCRQDWLAPLDSFATSDHKPLCAQVRFGAALNQRRTKEMANPGPSAYMSFFCARSTRSGSRPLSTPRTAAKVQVGHCLSLVLRPPCFSSKTAPFRGRGGQAGGGRAARQAADGDGPQWEIGPVRQGALLIWRRRRPLRFFFCFHWRMYKHCRGF